MGGFCSKDYKKGIINGNGKDVKRLKENVRVIHEEINWVIMFERMKDHHHHHHHHQLRESVKVLMEEKIREMNKVLKKKADISNETAQKWKQLYLSIKYELDDLLLQWQSQTDHIAGYELKCREREKKVDDEMNRELKAKEEKIKAMEEQVASKQIEIYKKQRDFDILRQSLRIINEDSEFSWS